MFILGWCPNIPGGTTGATGGRLEELLLEGFFMIDFLAVGTMAGAGRLGGGRLAKDVGSIPDDALLETMGVLWVLEPIKVPS